MLTIAHSTVVGIAADTQTVVQKTDQALLAQAQLFASLLEGSNGVGLPIGATQQIYASAHAHGTRLLEGRNELNRLITRLIAIKDMSNQREAMIGCPRGLPQIGSPEEPEFFTGASLKDDSERA